MATAESLAQSVYDVFQAHFENALSRVCKVVLILIPVLSGIGHVLSEDAPSNFASGWRFGLFNELINSYAWRSPGG